MSWHGNRLGLAHARFIRTFQKMRDENPNVKIIDVAKDCEIKNVSYRTLIHTLNDAGYRWLKSRRKGLLSADDRRQGAIHKSSFEKIQQRLYGQTTFFFTWMVFRLGITTELFMMLYV